MIRRKPNMTFHPSYWFSSLGAGGTAVSFFMYLMWMVPHKNTPIPTFADWSTQLNEGGFMAALTFASLVGIIVFSILHFALLFWNIAESTAFKKDLKALVNTPAEVQLMAIPVTFAMTVNVLFILGALFIPNLWASVELLFPGAIAAFALIGVYAVRIFVQYISNMVRSGGYASVDHNHLSALVSVFTFSMLSVGFAAASAMSHIAITAAIATTLSIAFFAFALLIGIIVLSHGINAIMKHGIAEAASPSLWMLIPILTVLGISWVRLSHGLNHHFGIESSPGSLFLPLTVIFMLQLGVFTLGYKVMKANHYLTYYLYGDKENPISFGLVCPGVALFVMGMFWWHIGWVKTGIIEPFSPAYWIGIGVLFTIQVITISALLKLIRKLLRHPTPTKVAHV
ncbi:TsoY family (seleno)protein [Marinomonas mediterranea]|jgi:hypothetical protein|uniref:C4-dicarboxylate transporter/malic acid transport protein n=1 Tax=Marinomonas mediterranea (strain ATCC 700492 / JCM 21426 / NBRC 103028 / MMB-1) TaxID=717774 RepID=F2JYU1_MARM1|nr:hypothetical protein [Marinomonas mediterranea]ADZ89716.1 hypothetical protein Marme_0417 [Marinomonas mediterranea MMB-1]WCN07806.1 hypothetical protein GV055_02135 [Marinomonas mediterranea]WCN11899.1 hypothetical protein GV054_02140 [Marinomonas mediterranea]WCN15944.1 hypothetical protein GV053_02090 [Marinomonas mediterranea MMB-1]